MAAKYGYYEVECSHLTCKKKEGKANKTSAGKKEEEEEEVTMKKCSRCVAVDDPNPARYCSKEHRIEDWTRHKKTCGKLTKKFAHDYAWKWRPTQDGNHHYGECELIHWNFKDEDGEELGWGAVLKEESAEHEEKFVRKFGGSRRKFINYWPNAFRWTCCGMQVGNGTIGCDHHGDPAAPFPCSCDFCRCGKPLPDKIWNEKLRSVGAYGLKDLRRGPDPNSLSQGGIYNFKMREMMFGLMGGDPFV